MDGLLRNTERYSYRIYQHAEVTIIRNNYHA